MHAYSDVRCEVGHLQVAATGDDQPALGLVRFVSLHPVRVDSWMSVGPDRGDPCFETGWVFGSPNGSWSDLVGMYDDRRFLCFALERAMARDDTTLRAEEGHVGDSENGLWSSAIG
jgi:hypothetical protein